VRPTLLQTMLVTADDLTLSDCLTEGEGDARYPHGEGGDGNGDAGIGGPREGGPEQPVLGQVAEPVCTVRGVKTGPGVEAETQRTQSDPVGQRWLWTPPRGPPPEYGPG
jgi:hypothetical protein